MPESSGAQRSNFDIANWTARRRDRSAGRRIRDMAGYPGRHSPDGVAGDPDRTSRTEWTDTGGVKRVRARTNTGTGPHPQKVVRR